MNAIWLALFFTSVSIALCDRQCDPTIEQHRNKHVVDDNNERVNITIETGTRITHNMASQILLILLKEQLGYADVIVIKNETYDYDAGNILGRIIGCSSESTCEADKPPTTMINLEVWLAPNFNIDPWTDAGLINTGQLGPIGRFGWYIPTTFVNKQMKRGFIIVDHWKSFRNEDIAAKFDCTRAPGFKSWIKDSTGGFMCKLEECEDGIYYSKGRCEGKNSICATLLFGDKVASDVTLFRAIIQQIESLELLVNIAWINFEYFYDIIDTYSDSSDSSSVLFFSSKPSETTSVRKYTSVLFPHCEDTKNPNFVCVSEVHQMQKVARSKLDHDILKVLHSMTFTQETYLSWIDSYIKSGRNNHDEFDAACNWVLDNKIVWRKWIPSISFQPQIYIAGIFPYSDESNLHCPAGIVTAVRMALDKIHSNHTFLSGYQLELLGDSKEEGDGGCKTSLVMRTFINYVTDPDRFPYIAGILGPACSDTLEPIVGLTKYFNLTMISYSADGDLATQDGSSAFFRTIPNKKLFSKIYSKILQQLGWRRIAAVTDGHKTSTYINSLKEEWNSLNYDFIINEQVTRTKDYNMTQALINLKEKQSKIIIGEFDSISARNIMCAAFRQNMSMKDGYFWFLPHSLEMLWFDTDTSNAASHSNYPTVPCTTQQMETAIDGYISLSYKYFADDNDTMQTGETVGEWKAFYKNLIHQSNVCDSMYAGFAYDAIWVYAYALDKLLAENVHYYYQLHYPETFELLIKIINSTKFRGVSGNVHFNGNSRLTDVVIYQWNSTSKTQEVLGHYSTDTSPENLQLYTIHWPAGYKPDDGTVEQKCLLEGLKTFLNVAECEIAIAIAGLMGFFLFSMLMLTGFCFFKHRYDEKVKNAEARIQELDQAASSLAALDEWEMPRDCIVINRKIGEGAFGAVYGGEALMEEPRGWVAVAVKTLKYGATIEEKLDFLSEAEMMKRFDSDFIVRLLGVCTSGEPVYNVMEFMLYGDLKTYLLARRHLVTNEKGDNYSEVSDKNLTSMALDISSGVEYLHENKYVHRDLACRNCLVNSNRRVKIADFGMCRPTFETNYYRFNKRGMMPVRWMAPESLIEGVFTPMTDMWSYGVLLYEMITFGNIPYQGLTNNLVLEYVKNFYTLETPQGCNPELKALLLQCWEKEPEKRPTAKDVIKYLNSYTMLIKPCLDLPHASVEHCASDAIELNLKERTRGNSFSNNKPQIKQSENGTATVVHSESSPSGQYITLEHNDSNYSLNVTQDCNTTSV